MTTIGTLLAAASHFDFEQGVDLERLEETTVEPTLLIAAYLMASLRVKDIGLDN